MQQSDGASLRCDCSMCTKISNTSHRYEFRHSFEYAVLVARVLANGNEQQISRLFDPRIRAFSTGSDSGHMVIKISEAVEAAMLS